MTSAVPLPMPKDVSAARQDGTSRTTHSGLSWQTAAAILLNAVGCHEDITFAKSLQDLARHLRNKGFDLAPTALIHGTIPDMEDKVGCLLQLDNGNWLAATGKNSEATLLSASGEAVSPLSSLNMQTVTGSWVLSERIVELHSPMPFLQRYKAYFLDIFIASIIVNFFALVLPMFSSFVYDKILGNGIVETMWALVIGLAFVIGVEFCVRVIRTAVAERFAAGSEVEIDRALFENLLRTPANRMPNAGKLLERYKQIVSYRDFLSSSYTLALADIPFLVLFLAVIAVVSGPLVFVPLACGILMLLGSLAFMSAVLHYDRRARAHSERRFGLMTDLLASREAVIGSSLRNLLTGHWRHASVSTAQASSMSRYWRGFNMALVNSLSYVCFVGVLVGGVYLVEERQLTGGGLLAASMLSSRAMGVFSSAVTLILRYREFRTALGELNKIAPSIAGSDKQAKVHGHLHGSLRFDKVTCRLRRGDMPVLGGINLAINSGEIVGIAGPPGAGKTTLLRLAAGVLQPDEGRILIDNIPLQDLSQEDVSLNIGFKPQEFCLLEGTVEDNVSAGRPSMSADDRREILTMSGLFRAFEEGSLHWTTDVGSRGSNLSGGQRQMVSLARAMLGKPSLLLLDEPGNGLDAALEAHLAHQLSLLRGLCTILVSSHSRNILSICDRIVVVGQSRILADGPREKILV